MSAFQNIVRAIYPPRCLTCDAIVVEEGGLCPACWREAEFLHGLVCDACGVPLPGDEDGAVHCDACMASPRPWSRGRAALSYRGTGRKLVLALKHGDRTDLPAAASRWMLSAGTPLIRPDMLIAPVPLHWRRLFRRRYNQSALLSGALASRAGLDHCPDLLRRARATPTQDGRDREARFENMKDAIALAPARALRIEGRHVLLVDDVMASGATLAACAEACLRGGASGASVLTLARAVRDT
jgi:ComF family protein